MMVLVTGYRSDDDPCHFRGRVVHSPTDTPAAGTQFPGLEVGRMAQAVPQASWRAVEKLCQLLLGQKNPESFREPFLQTF
jgi:hypothetical protein